MDWFCVNPVRAGMVNDPKDYRWCGYAAALAGDERAQSGLRTVMGKSVMGKEGVDVCAVYRLLLFGKAEQSRRCGITVEEIRNVYAQAGMLPPWEMCAHRVRWFGEGVIIGSREYVSECALKWNEVLNIKRGKINQNSPNDSGWCAMR